MIVSAMDDADEEIATTMLRLVGERGVGKTICPSEVARSLGGSCEDDWRALMEPVRRVAVRLARQGKVAILRGGRPIEDLDALTGIYRIGMPRDA